MFDGRLRHARPDEIVGEDVRPDFLVDKLGCQDRQNKVSVHLRTDDADPTVLDDYSRDLLTGSSGIDWFFANLGNEGVMDKITDLSDSEFAIDIDWILN